MAKNPLLLSVITLVAWSMFMWAWMYAVRLPAIFTARIKLNPEAPRGEQMNLLPARVRWKADNYNHLMEQPTIFYAIIFVLVMTGGGHDDLNIFFAWAYVLLRIIHSLVQSLGNIIQLRFVVYILSNIPLIGLVVQGCIKTL